MDYESQVILWIEEDKARHQALKIAASLNLNDWCLAAGFVRNLIWDKLHGFESPTPLNDVDFIYFDPNNVSDTFDKEHEAALTDSSKYPWSVKNQARMHIRNNDLPYMSTSDAMSYWVEIETAIGARIEPSGEITLVAPFGLNRLFEFTVTINSKRIKQADFQHRVNSKGWLKTWPKLAVNNNGVSGVKI